MKKNLLSIGLGVIFLFFNGCANKEVSTSNYYPNYTKDEILLAGKYTFKNFNTCDYIVDSYRDRLEVTKIELIFDTLYHKDYLLKVQEDMCGTLATLTIEGSFGTEKTDKYYFSQNEHLDIWERIDYFAGMKNPESNSSKPTKDMSTCIIKNEFENGLIKESVKNAFDDHNENH